MTGSLAPDAERPIPAADPRRLSRLARPLLALRLARRELRGAVRGFWIFLFSLALGVATITAIGLVREAIQTGLAREGALLLGGDAEAELTYRFASPQELDWLGSISDRMSEVVAFRSLALVGRGAGANRALTEVQAVDRNYPLVGAPRLDPEIGLDAALDGAGGLPGAVMEGTLADRLALQPGMVFRLGDQDFVYMARLLRWPDNANGGFGLGPKTILRTEDLGASGLIGEGTLFSTYYRLDLPPDADFDALDAEADHLFRDHGMRWQDARHGPGNTRRVIDRLGSFLVLIGLSGLVVGGIGVSVAVRSWLADRIPTIAVLRAIGADNSMIVMVYLLQILALTCLGIALGLIIGTALPLLAAPLLTAQLPVPARFAIYAAPLAQAAVYGLLIALIFTLWPLSRMERIRPAALFREPEAASRHAPRLPWILALALLSLALVLAATLFIGSIRLVLWTGAGLAGGLAALALAAFGLRHLVRRMRGVSRGRPALRLALAAMAVPGGAVRGTLLSLGLGLTVLAAIGQTEANMRRALTSDLPDQAPSYFVVDIQPDQIDAYLERVRAAPGVSRVDSAPMLRGIITGINGRPAEEVAPGSWVLRGDRGVTYSAAPPGDTRLTAGEWWPEDYEGDPLMSFSSAEAAEMGLRLGDRITVNILGREITARIASFREVEFQTAGMGFVMAMNPSALRGAPHSWISTIYADPASEAAIIRDLAETWPNITAIGIRETVGRVAELVTGVMVATRIGALVTLATGVLVLIGTAGAMQRDRTHEAAVMRSLGATRGLMLWSFILRAALVGAAAGAVALIAAVIAGWALVSTELGIGFEIDWRSAITIILGGLVVSTLSTLGFALRSIMAPPAVILRSRE